MKNKFKFLSIILCFFIIMEVVLPTFDVTYAVISDSNTMLIACGVTIKNNTTMQQVVSQYGQQPKITTSSVFGGTANTFYKEGYEDLLYVETNEAGVVMSAGTCAKEFQSSLTNSGDPFKGTVSYMQGYTIDDWDDGAIGVLVYNKSIRSYAEAPKLLDKWYANQYEYEKNLCQHSIPIVNCYLTRDGDDTIEFNNEVYDTLAKIEQNGKDLITYAEENDKTDLYKRVVNDTGYLATYEALPNPFRACHGASGFLATETKKYGYFKYHIEPSENNGYNAGIEGYYVSRELIQKGGEAVELTQDEKDKLEAAKAMYQKSLDEYNQSGSVDHEVEPVYKTTPLVAGKIYENRLVGAVDYLNSIRVAAGLPIVKHSPELSNIAQHKSVLCVYINNYAGYTKEELKNINAHYPPKPDAVSQEFYDTAMSQMSGENLYTGSIITSIYNAINDGYGDPITCGHRYNLLNPSWKYFGLGEVADQSAHRFGGYQSYNNIVVAWPSEGITPIEAYTGGYWTCQIRSEYQVTANTTVEVTRLNDNKTWNFTNRTTSGTNKFAVNGALLSFYNQDLTGKDGLVYKFVIHNLKSISTGEITDYTYRSAFKSLAGTDKKALKYPESISLDKSKVVIEKGQKLNLKTTFGGQYVTEVCVNFSSSSNDTVEVDQYGTITGIKNGTANISATTLNGKTATCEVRVIDGVELDVNSISMMEKTTKKVNAIVAEGNTLTWSSSDNNIVSVDNDGNLTAQKSGTATITVTASNNKKAQLKVTVTKYQKGDMDKNGVITANDASIVLDLYKNGKPTSEEIAIGDMDGNGTLTANDASMILDIYKNGK